MKRLIVALALFATPLSRATDVYDQSGVPLEVDAPRAGLAKVILLAGGPSSKAMAHEYFAGCASLMDWLKQQPGVWPVMARGWPTNESVLTDARCIVYFGDGGGKQPFVEAKRWCALQRLRATGAGIVLLHQAMDFPLGPQEMKSSNGLAAYSIATLAAAATGTWNSTRSPHIRSPTA